jgi:signal transduction histidine kinase
VRPLDRIPSIKAKLSIVIVAAVVVTAVVGVFGVRAGLPALVGLVLAIGVALALVQVLARGLTAPLRAMARAAGAMAAGEHGRTVAVTSRDEVGELARAFNAMSSQLAETDRMRRDLVANAAHELRTPISALQAVLENVVDGVESADPATLRTMLAQVQRLGRLTNQLLSLSNLESGGVAYAPVRFALAPVLEEAIAESRLHAVAPAPVDVDLAPADLAALGDPVRVHQVVVNLVDNALRHSPAGARVTVTARAHDGAVRIEVADEGPGIPDGEAERIFERFYRADAARADDGGAGLGLAIVRWIVDLHGGAVRAERRDPRGCRMVVDLPAGAA